MHILIDIGHPAHVHLFKNFAWEMQKKRHEIFFTCREKEFEIHLLKSYGFQYKSFGAKYKSRFGKILGLVNFGIKELITGINFKPDIFISHGSIYAAHAAFLLRKPHISLEDSGNMEQIRLYLPFTQAVITPDVLEVDLGKKMINYSGYHELAYLHPNNFVPDNSILDKYGLDIREEYAIIRFVSWSATHDKGQLGFTEREKKEVIDYLIKKKIKVFITSESELPIEYNQYQNIFPPESIHHFLAFARIVISEGATLASEAGVLGAPTIYVNSIKRCYNEDQEERYSTVYNYRSGSGVLKRIEELVSVKRSDFGISKKMVDEKIDLTAFLVWFVEDWPESFNIMKENPDYQYRFK
ncbi:MAG: DUF354 domain-containing protein [Deltaproteobacteria bacterium]|nr:DUF354 domain-containing protein [Deltaproteobacteria bacterium]